MEENVSSLTKDDVSIQKSACSICQKTFIEKKNLLKHLRKAHNAKETAELLTVRKMLCSVEGCAGTFRWMNNLRDHLATVHHIDLYSDDLHFPSIEEFRKWKAREEAESVSCFVSFRRRFKLKEGGWRQCLTCHRSGPYCSKTPGKCRSKIVSTRKIGRSCPAVMLITELPDTSVKVLYHKTHVGHSMDLACLRLSKEDRIKISKDISDGFSLDAILQSAKESCNTGDQPCNRMSLLSRKDLHNIMKSFRVTNSSVKKRPEKIRIEENTSMEKGYLDNLGLIQEEVNVGNGDNGNRATGIPIDCSSVEISAVEQTITPQIVYVSSNICYPPPKEVYVVQQHPETSRFPETYTTNNQTLLQSVLPSETYSTILAPVVGILSDSVPNSSHMLASSKCELIRRIHEKLEKLYESLNKTGFLSPEEFQKLDSCLEEALEMSRAVAEKQNLSSQQVK